MTSAEAQHTLITAAICAAFISPFIWYGERRARAKRKGREQSND